MEADLQGTVESLSLPKEHGLWPVFEALQNSLDALAERQPDDIASPARVTVEIVRDGVAVNGSGCPPVRGAIITDNGVGLTNESWGAFQKIFTRRKAKIGGKGVGRLTWLKVFREARVESVYEDAQGARRKRSFSFRLPSGVEDFEEAETDAPIRTRVELIGLRSEYREGVNVRPPTVARRVIEHFLTFFVLESGVRLEFIDGDLRAPLAKLYRENLVDASEAEQLVVDGAKLQLRHFLVRGFKTGRHEARWCARERVVISENVSHEAIPGLGQRVDVEGQSSIYYCYVTSPLLTKSVNSARTRFSIPQRGTEEHVGMDELQSAVRASMRKFLEPHTRELLEATERKLGEVLEDAPRYRYIAERYPERLRQIAPTWDHRRIEVELAKVQAGVDIEVRLEANKILAKGAQPSAEKLEELTGMVTAAQRSDLAAYVAHRRIILDMMRSVLERDSDSDRYPTEAALHRLVFPMRSDSTELTGGDDEHNLWTIDERLAFYSYLASDQPFNRVKNLEVPEDGELRRADLIALDRVAAFGLGDPLDLRSITLVEFKRAEGMETSQDDPVERLMEYANLIRRGKVVDGAGGEVNVDERTPIFGFAVCKLTASFKRRLRQRYSAVASVDGSLTISRPEDHLHIQVLPYRTVVLNAERRNEVFFKKAGLPSTRS